MLVYGRAPAICGVFVPKPDFERMWRISHKQPLKHKCRNWQKAICNNYGVLFKRCLVANAGYYKLELFWQCCMRAVFFCVLFHAKQRIAVLFFCCKRKLLCYLVFIANERSFVAWLLQANGALMIYICCKHTKGFCIVEYCKKSNFGQKTKRENGKKHKHWQKNYTSV